MDAAAEFESDLNKTTETSERQAVHGQQVVNNDRHWKLKVLPEFVGGCSFELSLYFVCIDLMYVNWNDMLPNLLRLADK